MNEREDVRQTNTRENHRRELARFLRARRESISPGEAGLAQHGRRRTPGLRREEVALLAGIGVAWYSKLEMGHDVTASASTLLAIARALQLNPAQTEYLFALASVAVPRAPRAEQSGIPEAIEQLILTTHEVGAVIWDRYMTALRWNAIGDAMFDFSNYEDPLERNAIVRLNRDKFRAPYYGPDYEQLMRSLVGIFRMAYATAEPTPFARRVYEIAQSYPLFQRFWEDQLIGEALFDTDPGPFERHHEVVGSYSILTSNLRLLRRDDMFLRIFAPADAAAKEKFERLRSLGAPSTRQTRLPE